MTLAVEAQNLEVRAAEQRRQIRESVGELREAITHKLDIRANAREHIIPASALVALVGLALGYTLTDIIFYQV